MSSFAQHTCPLGMTSDFMIRFAGLLQLGAAVAVDQRLQLFAAQAHGAAVGLVGQVGFEVAPQLGGQRVRPATLRAGEGPLP